MANLKVVKQRIKEAKENGRGTLNLSKLGLTSKDLAQFIPVIEKELPNLYTLYLNDNNLESIPDSIKKLSNLYALYLANNNLKSLPDSIGELNNLVDLFLTNNKLKSLPDSIGKLSKLIKLYLDKNKLEILPESMRNLSKLEWLHLKYNNITIIPKSIINMTGLQYMSLSENPLSLIILLNISTAENSRKKIILNKNHRRILHILKNSPIKILKIAERIAQTSSSKSIEEFDTFLKNSNDNQMPDVVAFDSKTGFNKNNFPTDDDFKAFLLAQNSTKSIPDERNKKPVNQKGATKSEKQRKNDKSPTLP